MLRKGSTQQAVLHVPHSIIAASPALTQLSGDVSLASFCPEGFIGIGVPIGTDAFVQNFVAKTCRAIIDDVEIWTRFKTVLYITSSLGSARPPDSNILTLTF